MRVITFLLVLYIITPNAIASKNECEEWFQKGGVTKGKNCLLNCTSAMVDMSTFHCPNMCNMLCSSPSKESFIFQLSNIYPGLTAEERALSAKYPSKMLTAYKLSWKAEKLCSSLFISSQTNDASDACRHFIWAALLYKKYGIDFSTQVLRCS